MRRARAFLLLVVLMVAIATLIAGPALAQELPRLDTMPPEEGGYCAPWHRCVAYGALGLAAITVVMFGLGYLVQSRGFDKLEHRQGNPDGVSVDKR